MSSFSLVAPAVSRVNSLPQELLKDILFMRLSVAAEDFAHTGDRSPFRHARESTSVLLQVCKLWLQISTPLLYHTVLLRSNAQAQALGMTLMLNPALGPSIRQLRVEGTYGDSIFVIVSYATNITDLCLTLRVWSYESAAGFVAAIKQVNPTRVTLTLAPKTIPTNRKHRNVLQALSSAIPIWTNLRVFRFAGTRIQLGPGTAIPDYIAFPELVLALASNSAVREVFMPTFDQQTPSDSSGRADLESLGTAAATILSGNTLVRVVLYCQSQDYSAGLRGVPFISVGDGVFEHVANALHQGQRQRLDRAFTLRPSPGILASAVPHYPAAEASTSAALGSVSMQPVAYETTTDLENPPATDSTSCAEHVELTLPESQYSQVYDPFTHESAEAMWTRWGGLGATTVASPQPMDLITTGRSLIELGHILPYAVTVRQNPDLATRLRVIRFGLNICVNLQVDILVNLPRLSTAAVTASVSILEALKSSGSAESLRRLELALAVAPLGAVCLHLEHFTQLRSLLLNIEPHFKVTVGSAVSSIELPLLELLVVRAAPMVLLDALADYRLPSLSTLDSRHFEFEYVLKLLESRGGTLRRVLILDAPTAFWASVPSMKEVHIFDDLKFTTDVVSTFVRVTHEYLHTLVFHADLALKKMIFEQIIQMVTRDKFPRLTTIKLAECIDIWPTDEHACRSSPWPWRAEQLAADGIVLLDGNGVAWRPRLR